MCVNDDLTIGLTLLTASLLAWSSGRLIPLGSTVQTGTSLVYSDICGGKFVAPCGTLSASFVETEKKNVKA